MDLENARNVFEELDRLKRLHEAGLDEKGRKIPNIYHKVVLETPLCDERYRNLFVWLDANIDADNYIRHWVTDFYFINEEDAMAFKLRWL